MTDTCNNRTFSLSESQVDALTDRQAYGQTDSKQTDRPHSQHASMASASWEDYHQLCVKYTVCQCAGCKIHKAVQTDKQTAVQTKGATSMLPALPKCHNEMLHIGSKKSLH